MIKYYLLFIAIFKITYLYSQINSDFIVNDSSCINQNISLINNSTNANSYIWDFCFEDLQNSPTTNLFNITVLDNAEGIEIEYDSGFWYGFVASRNNSSLIRLDFGNSLENIPDIVNLGNISGLLNWPKDVRFIKENGNWYGILANLNGSNLIRIEFGSKLDNKPTAHNIGNIGSWSGLRGIDLAIDNNQIIVITSSYNNNKISLVNFGNSILNDPTATDVLHVDQGLANKPIGCSLLKVNDKWFGSVANYGSNSVIKMEFGNNLFSVPVLTSLPGVVTQATDALTVREGSNLYIFGTSRNGGIIKYIFDNSFENDPVYEQIENPLLLNIFTSRWIYNPPYWKGFFVSASSKNVIVLDFKNNCDEISLNTSVDKDPDNLNYTKSGDYIIGLTSFDSFGNKNYFEDSVYILNEYVPEISIESDNSCISDPNNFIGSSPSDPSITSWNWNFGDGDTGSGQNVSHQYLSTGTYDVVLDIESNNGCANSTKKPITIYDPPSPDFDLPAGIICSNSETSFTNTTNLHGADTLVTWSWNFNNQGTSSDEHPNFVFPDGGSKNITLTAAIPGCSENISKPLNVTNGPDVDFTWSGTCEYELFGFINNTTGSDITGYEWDFGDGYVSSVTSPTHRFDNGGNYTISLTAQNVSGCVNTFEQIVPVRYEPDMDFNNELACSGSEIQFFDLSSVTTANITSRIWSSRPENTGSFQYQASGLEPFLSFDNPETYDVQLIVESNYGCVDTLVKSVNVIEGPTADFIIQNNCLGDSSHLLNNSTAPQGSSIVSADWLIEGNMYSGEEIKYKFSNLGEYEVQLYVRSDNLCSNNIQKSVQINPAPSVNFNMSSECANTGITFSSDIISDFSPVAEYEWIIDGNVVSTEPTMIYSFPGASDQTVQLHVVTEDLCSATHENTITLKPRPVAAFDAFPEYGAQPLIVSFSDQSLGAESIVWDFSTKNSDSSIESEPSYTYSDLGEDIVSLIAKNEFNCVDTAQKTIRVVIPDYDATLSDVSFSVVDDAVQFSMTIRNSGNILISHPDITVRISDKLQLIQKVDEEILPGQEIDYEFSFQLLQLENNPIDYVCFSLSESIGDFNDINPEDNHQCLSLNEEFLLIDPYPNPAKSYVNVPLIMPSQGYAMIRLFGSKGEIVFARTFNDLNPGLNLIRFELEPYNAGLYFLSVQYDNTKITRKIVIR